MGERDGGAAQQQALVEALAAVLRPLARLALARGLTFARAEEVLARAFVEAALGGQPSAARQVSRVATATGINRREVKRLLAAEPAAPRRAASSVAAEAFAHWTTARGYRDRRGAPRVLPRQGAGASFESLARSITTDVHPRSVLDELLRLGLAAHDAERDTVRLQHEAYVPRGDARRMLGFLSDNVGDHLSGAVDNVLGDGRQHFEQAVFAEGLSAHAMPQVRGLVGAQWKALTEALVPALEAMIEDDGAAARPAARRLRIGLYAYDTDAAPLPARGAKEPR